MHIQKAVSQTVHDTHVTKIFEKTILLKSFLLFLVSLCSQLHFHFYSEILHGHLLCCWPSCAALMPIRMLWTNLVEPPAVQQGGQLVQTGLRGVEQMLDTQ